MASGSSYLNLENTRRQAAGLLATREPEKVAKCSQIPFDRDQQIFKLNFLDREYRITFPEGEIYLAHGAKAPVYPSIIILHYLVTADGKELSGEWISFRQLPGGDIYMVPFRKRAIDPFIKIFGCHPRLFCSSARALGGHPGPLTGTNLVIPVLPRVPISFTLWAGDEEFPPSANILFDSSASSYLPTEDYAHLPGMVIGAMKSCLASP